MTTRWAVDCRTLGPSATTLQPGMWFQRDKWTEEFDAEEEAQKRFQRQSISSEIVSPPYEIQKGDTPRAKTAWAGQANYR